MPSKLLIAGLGRCGTSLVMQMLAAAGLRVPGRYPTFESKTAFADLDMLDAVKWLGPGVMDADGEQPPTCFGYRVLWLDRDITQQAMSRAKFQRAAGASEMLSRPSIIRQLIPQDLRTGLRTVAKYSGHETVRLNFETLLSQPKWSAQLISDMYDNYLDVDKMAAVVRPRTPRCYPGFLESELADATS